MLRITNTLSRKKEPLTPSNPGTLSLYVCGMTVYDHCHIGHARSAIIFDVIRDYLEYKGFTVDYVKNYTDVDDKIIARAQREGRDWREISAQFITSYERDMERLGVRPPSLTPKATDHIPEMIQVIEGLVSKEVAYVVDGDVFFQVRAFRPYGKLSHRKLDELVAGARVEVDPRKKSPLDFALWKASKPGEPAWKSPWGMGRPGWHIECSAMGMKHLGNHIDLHGGGEDLIFPHHENEVAQSEAYTGEDFVSCWIHHGFVTIDKEKMSKSLGNFFTVDEIFQNLSQFPDPVISEVLRFFLLSTQYRSPIDFSVQSLQLAKRGLDNFYILFQKIDEISDDARKDRIKGKGDIKKEAYDPGEACDPEETKLEQFRTDFEMAMDDDFNTAKAIGLLQELRSAANLYLKKEDQKKAIVTCQTLKALGKLLGFFRSSPQEWRFQSWDLSLETRAARPGPLDEEMLLSLIKEREVARENKEWAKSDRIRDQLIGSGVIIEDRPDGTTRIKR